MGASVTRRNMFFIEPYASIIALLDEFLDRGLTLKEIQYAIMEEHQLYHVSLETRDLLDDKIKQLAQATLLKKYRMKIIKRFLKRSGTKKNNKAKVIRSNLVQVLNRLIHPRANAIYVEEKKIKNKRKTYYKLKKEIHNEWVRQRNLAALSMFPPEQIFHTTFKPEPENEIQKIVSWVLFGFSEELYEKLEKDEKEKFSNCLYAVEDYLEKLDDIRYNSLMREWDKRIVQYAVKIKNNALNTSSKYQ